MLGHSVSDLKLEQTLYALWITNNTKMGQKMYICYTMDTPTGRMKKFTVIAVLSNSDEEDGSENENDLVSSSNKFFLKQ